MPYTNYPNQYSGTEQGVTLTSINTSGVIDLSLQQDATPKNPVGCITRYQGKLYRYVKMGEGTSVAGAPAYWMTDLDPSLGIFTVTATNGATGADNCFAGIFLAAAITVGKYIWVQCGGLNEALVCTAGAVIGERLTAIASNTLTRLADAGAQTNTPVAICTIAEAAGVAGGIILGPYGV